ncbi:MAG: flavin reductase [Blastocatellia bacterium AA13]|nr:MAG: flavin reductase [Blastocatellia bacterium AA13]
MGVSKDEFRQALSHFASGVTVVTARCSDDECRGITVSAFSSLSLDPPLILVCIDKRSSLHDHLQVSSHFAVNILAHVQEDTSRRFASRDPDRFSGVTHSSGVSGSPLIAGSIAHLECCVVNVYPGGDHSIIVGEVISTDVNHEGAPLTYFRGGYSTTTPKSTT